MTTASSLSVSLPIVRLRDDAVLPKFATRGAAGADLSACIEEPLALAPGAFLRVPTGIAIGLPPGFEAQIRPRSGLAARHGVTVLNSPGTIDADYRGELVVLLINHGKEEFLIQHGERIAQIIIAPVPTVTLIEVNTLDETERGLRGFGSTGGFAGSPDVVE